MAPFTEPTGEALLAPSPLPDAMWQRIRRYQADARSENTRRAYQSQAHLFQAWCASHGISADPPVSPIIVAAWLTDRADSGLSRSAITTGYAAIAAAYRDAGVQFDRENPQLLATLAGLHRTLVRPTRQVAGLKGVLLSAILDHTGESNIEIRDAALLATLYAFALRRSELAGLDFGALGRGSGFLRLTPTTMDICLVTSKSSPGAEIMTNVRLDSNPRAVTAIERWLEHSNPAPGSPDLAISTATRHKSIHSLARYGQQADQTLTAPHRRPGVGV